MEDGKQKRVTEAYLVDALSFTEAEARIIEEVAPFISGEFTVKDIKRAKISELFFNENGDRFYKIKVYFITLDEKSGAEKKTAAQMLAQASNLKDAIAVLEKGMKGTLVDYEIASVTETQLMDVFPYEAGEDNKDKENSKLEELPGFQRFFQSLPEGQKTEITVDGKTFVVDKTGKDTVVTPKEDSNKDDVRGTES
jgi:hypothetical protein